MKSTQMLKPRTEWRIKLNDKRTEIRITRLKTAKEHIEYLVKNTELKQNFGFFKVRTNSFSTHMMDMRVDVIFVDDDEQVIGMYQDMKEMVLTPSHEGSKYVYILGAGTIRANQIKMGDVMSHQKWKRRD